MVSLLQQIPARALHVMKKGLMAMIILHRGCQTPIIFSFVAQARPWHLLTHVVAPS